MDQFIGSLKVFEKQMNLLHKVRALLANAFKSDDSRVGQILLRSVCDELLADIPGALSEEAKTRLRWVQSDEDVRHLRVAMFEAISRARGQGEATVRIASFDRRVFLNSAYSLMRN